MEAFWILRNFFWSTMQTPIARVGSEFVLFHKYTHNCSDPRRHFGDGVAASRLLRLFQDGNTTR
jgi:hypothetical protein